MKVNVQSVNFNADQKLIDFIQRRLDKLENFYDKVTYANVYLKTENTSDRNNKTTEILLNIPGGNLMVKKTCRKFEECVDESVAAMQRQLIKRKEKLSAYA